MIDKYEVIQNAIGASGLTTDDTTSGYINPELWNRQLMDHVSSQLVVAGRARVRDDILGESGESFTVNIKSEPSAATALTETTDVSITEFATTKVDYSPTEYGAAYQLHDKEARRAFFDVSQEMIKNLGYQLSLKRDQEAISVMESGAGNSVVANGVASSALASSDTIDYDDIVDAVKEIRKDKLFPKDLFVSPDQFAQLAKDQNFKFVEHAGTDETLRMGQMGKIYGLTVYETDLITTDGDSQKALVHAVDASGNSSFGIGRKALPEVRSEYHALGRYSDIVAVEEWDMQVERANGICTIESYAA